MDSNTLNEVERLPASAGSGRITVGDKYHKNGRTLEIVQVDECAVAFVITERDSRVVGLAVLRKDFERLEKTTLENGAVFEPFPNTQLNGAPSAPTNS